ncbi:Hypothetical predicted protein, partial [Olea europaea subsp. europaea]
MRKKRKKRGKEKQQLELQINRERSNIIDVNRVEYAFRLGLILDYNKVTPNCSSS